MIKCVCCDKEATRWDGGCCSVMVKDDKLVPHPPIWLCDEHDPRHKYFDLPDTLEEALEELECLRNKLQETFAKITYEKKS